MKKMNPTRTETPGIQACVEPDCEHCQERTASENAPETVNKELVAANIFRKYYEALLQGYSMDFFKGNRQHGGLHCT